MTFYQNTREVTVSTNNNNNVGIYYLKLIGKIIGGETASSNFKITILH